MNSAIHRNLMCAAVMTAAVLVSGSARAEVETNERVLKDTTTMIALKLDSESVFCTDKGYGNVQLKVSVPELDHLGHFDHRVSGEKLPCITGGSCVSPWDPTGPGLKPEDFIVAGQPFAVVPVRVILSEELQFDTEKGTCSRRLREKVTSHIRGRNFQHLRSSGAESLVLEKCTLTSGL